MSQSTNDDFSFADAHVHFYDMNHPTLHYGHWQPDEDHPVLGAQTRKLGKKNFLAENFIELNQGKVHPSVAIENGDNIFIGESVEVRAGSVLDAQSGPI